MRDNIVNQNNTQGNNKAVITKNKQVDNSINNNKQITNSKIISKSKNKEKKNRNLLPPQEPPTFENGNFSSKTKEVFNHNILKPEIFDVSFIRPNLEILYNEGQQVEMFAYVECYRKHDNRFVLCNLCSESDFLSDHILVDLDPEGELENRIGQCIKFNGVVYKYGDKFSVHVYDVSDIEGSIPNKLELISTVDKINKKVKKINNLTPEEALYHVNVLSGLLNSYSCQMFGNRKFILGMIFDFYFMRTRNQCLSENNYRDELNLCKYDFLLLFSDIVYRIETHQFTNFADIRKRILQFCIVAQSLPVNKNDLLYSVPTISFCNENKIDLRYVTQYYIKNFYKRYKIKNLRLETDDNMLVHEALFAAANVLELG